MKLTEAMTLPLAEPEGVQALGRRALEELAAFKLTQLRHLPQS